MTEFETNYLAHHGIKGQKWGIRRFQNPDGSLTSDGRKHYGIGAPRNSKDAKKEKAAARAARRAEKKAMNEAESREKLKEYLRKHPKKMASYGKILTQDEAKEVIDQINFDRKLKEIRDTEVQAGWKKVQNISSNIQTVSNFINNTKTLYNNTAEVYNTLVDVGVVKSGHKMQKVGEIKKDDRSDIEKIVRSGTAQDVYENRTQMSAKELEDAIKRLNYEEQLRTKHGVKENK